MSIARNKLAQIHIAKQQLGMLDEDYRAVLYRCARVTSAKKLDERGARAVLEEFRKMGWKPKAPARAGRVPNTFNKHEQMAKIEAQLSDLNAPWEYAQAIARQQFGIERIDWLRTESQFRAVIAALHAEQEKRDMLAALDALLTEQGKTRADLAEELSLPPRWQRNRRVLQSLIQHYAPE